MILLDHLYICHYHFSWYALLKFLRSHYGYWSCRSKDIRCCICQRIAKHGLLLVRKLCHIIGDMSSWYSIQDNITKRLVFWHKIEHYIYVFWCSLKNLGSFEGRFMGEYGERRTSNLVDYIRRFIEWESNFNLWFILLK